METMLKTDEKFGGGAQKFVNKLNKQEIEQWRQLGNSSELFLAKKIWMETM